MKRYFFTILMLYPLFLCAQNTSYFMERLPQKVSFNPAFLPEIDFYLTLPGIGGFSGSVYNSGYNYNQLDYFLDHISDENYNPDNFVNSMGNYNRTIAEFQTNILSFGFKIKENQYFSFSITENNFLNLRAASDIAYLLADVNDIQDEDFPITVDDIDMLVNNYLTFSFAYSRKIDENLTLGISPKINFSQLGMKTNSIGYRVELDNSGVDKEYNHYLLGGITLGLPFEINQEAINGDELDLDQNVISDNWDNEISGRDLFRNASLSFDLGATYELNQWTISASILNVGASRLKNNSYSLYGDNETVKIKEKNKVKIGIPTRIYLGADYQFSKKWNTGIVLNNTFYPSGSLPAATISLNGFVGSALSTSVSYTAGYKFDNLGLGLRLRFLPGTDFFFVTDNIIQTFRMKNANRMTAAIGINLAFGVLGETENTFETN